MRKHMLALPVLVVLLAGSAVGVTAQSPAPEQGVLVTEEVEPGVERIISDGAGHDLDAKHPRHRYDMDGIAITPDGTVWLTTTYSRGDNLANRWQGPFVWALGQPETYTLRYENPPPTSPYLYVQRDGTQTIIESVSSNDGAFIPVPELMVPPGSQAQRLVVEAQPDGKRICRTTSRKGGVTCKDPSGEATTYLSRRAINRIAAAPDGTLWAVVGFQGDNGDNSGLYRITPD